MLYLYITVYIPIHKQTWSRRGSGVQGCDCNGRLWVLSPLEEMKYLLNLYFHFVALVSWQRAALSFASHTQCRYTCGRKSQALLSPTMLIHFINQKISYTNCSLIYIIQYRRQHDIKNKLHNCNPLWTLYVLTYIYVLS